MFFFQVKANPVQIRCQCFYSPAIANSKLDYLAIFIVNKQIDVSFSRVCPVIGYWQWILSQHCQSSLRIHSTIASRIRSYFDNVMTKFMLNSRTVRMKNWRQFVNFIDTKTKSGIQLICLFFLINFFIIFIAIPFDLSPFLCPHRRSLSVLSKCKYLALKWNFSYTV